MSVELPKSRLATTDETGKRVYLYPASVRGRFVTRKKAAHAAMVLFFLALPWVRPGGRQLVLLDVARREFHIFGLHLRAHDAPLLLFLLLGFAFGIGFVTAIWGRLWCGWACPQTVFTESLFRKIETWIEGNHLARRALDLRPFDADKIARKSGKWLAFLAVSLVITHSFLAYFVGSREILGMVTSSPSENWHSFLVIMFTTGVILFDFGWFREQFCVIMCPYGRFQSVMLDSQSMVVGYDEKRGEPRRGSVPRGDKQADCVDCLRCVNVCPTGIDIRRGLQMECIACTACIDACDEVMAKTRKPAGLIRYTTLAELRGKPRRRLTPRAAIYAALTIASLGALAFSLRAKDYLEVTLLRAQGAPYDLVPGPTVVNHFRLEISNQTGSAQSLRLSLPADVGEISLVMPVNPLPLKDNAAQRADFFLRFPPRALVRGSRKILLHWEAGEMKRDLEVTLVGPDA
jgi:cytochrome c oxidase accessory protein FixG